MENATYKPVPPGYIGWRCGGSIDENGDCPCGDSVSDPSCIACLHGELVPAYRDAAKQRKFARRAEKKAAPHPERTTE